MMSIPQAEQSRLAAVGGLGLAHDPGYDDVYGSDGFLDTDQGRVFCEGR